MYLHDAEVAIGLKRFILYAVADSITVTSFAVTNGTFTSFILHYFACYFFDSHSRDRRGLVVANGSSVLLSVLLKFANIL